MRGQQLRLAGFQTPIACTYIQCHVHNRICHINSDSNLVVSLNSNHRPYNNIIRVTARVCLQLGPMVRLGTCIRTKKNISRKFVYYWYIEKQFQSPPLARTGVMEYNGQILRCGIQRIRRTIRHAYVYLCYLY
jgi:hypothetical protein